MLVKNYDSDTGVAVLAFKSKADAITKVAELRQWYNREPIDELLVKIYYSDAIARDDILEFLDMNIEDEIFIRTLIGTDAAERMTADEYQQWTDELEHDIKNEILELTEDNDYIVVFIYDKDKDTHKALIDSILPECGFVVKIFKDVDVDGCILHI